MLFPLAVALLGLGFGHPSGASVVQRDLHDGNHGMIYAAMNPEGCNADNCARCVTGTNLAAIKPYTPIPVASRQADCSRYQTATITPTASTVTVTVTRDASQIPSSTTTTTASTTPSASAKTVPFYAEPTCGASQYASACSCWGYTATSLTLAPTTTTTTATVTTTSSMTVLLSIASPQASAGRFAYGAYGPNFFAFPRSPGDRRYATKFVPKPDGLLFLPEAPKSDSYLAASRNSGSVVAYTTSEINAANSGLDYVRCSPFNGPSGALTCNTTIGRTPYHSNREYEVWTMGDFGDSTPISLGYEVVAA